MTKTLLFGLVLTFLILPSVLALDDSILYYSYDDANISGSNPLDLSGYGNDGTTYGATTGVTGVIGQAFSFDGVNDYVDTNYQFDSSVYDFTFATWIYLDSGTPNGYVFGSYNGATLPGLLHIQYIDGYGIRYEGRDSSSVTVASGFADLNISEWTHIAFTRSVADNTIKVYMNGVLVNTTTDNRAGHFAYPASIKIGSRGSATTYIKGDMDESVIYTRALSDAEVANLANHPVGYNPYATLSEYVTITLDAPENNKNVAQNSAVNVNYSLNFAGHNITSCSLYGNFGGSWGLNQTKTETFTTGSTHSFDTIYLNTGSYSWNVLCTDNTSAVYSAASNYTLNVYSPNQLTDALLYYSFDDEDLLGSDVQDLSGNSRTGSNNGAATGVTGVLGQAFSFDGVNDFLHGDVNLSNSEHATISFWVKYPAQTGTRGLLSSGSIGVATEFEMWHWTSDSTNWRIVTSNSASYGKISKATLTPSDTWTMVTIVFNGSESTNENRLKVYKNAVLQNLTFTGTIAATFASGFDKIVLGAGNYNPATYYIQAQYDELAIYNKSLSQSLIEILYDAGNGYNPYGLSDNNVLLHSPASGSTQLTDSSVVFNYSITSNGLDNVSITSCSLYINSSGSWGLNATNNYTHTLDTTYYNFTIPSMPLGTYIWNVLCTDNTSTVHSAASNYTLHVVPFSVVDYANAFVSNGNTLYYDILFNNSEPSPLVIMTDAFSTTSTRVENRPQAHYLMNAGFFVVNLDTRGKGDSTGQHDQGGLECVDIYEATQDAINGEYGSLIDPNNVYIWGNSGAGGRTQTCTGKYIDYFDAAISFFGIGNYSHWYSYDASRQSSLSSWIGGSPTTNNEGYTSRNSHDMQYNGNYNIHTPLALFHDPADSSVPPSYSSFLYGELNGLGRDVAYYSDASIDHSFNPLDSWKDIAIEWLNNHTDAVQMPQQGEFMVAGRLISRNFSIIIDHMTDPDRVGYLNYNLTNSTYVQMNLNLRSYTGAVNYTFKQLAPNSNFTIYNGSNAILTSFMTNSNGFASFNLTGVDEQTLTFSTSLPPEPPQVLPTFDITAQTLTAQPLSNISVFLSNGSIKTNASSAIVSIPYNGSQLWNFTVHVNGYWNQTFTNYNISNNLLVSMTQFPFIATYDEDTLASLSMSANTLLLNGSPLGTFNILNYAGQTVQYGAHDALYVRYNGTGVWSVSRSLYDSNTTTHDLSSSSLNMSLDALDAGTVGMYNSFTDESMTGYVYTGVTGWNVGDLHFNTYDTRYNLTTGSATLLTNGTEYMIFSSCPAVNDFSSGYTFFGEDCVYSPRYIVHDFAAQPTLNQSMYQLAVNLTAYEIITGNIVTGASFTIGGTTFDYGETGYINAGTHNVTFNAAGYISKTQEITFDYQRLIVLGLITAYTDTGSLTGVSATAIELNASDAYNATPIQSFSAVVSNDYYGYVDNYSTTTGSINISTAASILFNITITASGYNSISHEDYNTSSDLYTRMYPNNKVKVKVYNGDTGALITNPVTVRIENTSTQQTFNLATGEGYITNVAQGLNHIFNINSSGLVTATYTKNILTPTAGDDFMSFYMLQGDLNVTFTVIDTGSAQIENAIVTLERFVNGSYATVGSLSTDVLGKAYTSQATGQTYKITVSKSGYVSKEFIVSTLQSSYTIVLSKSTTIDVSKGREKVRISYFPTNLQLNASQGTATIGVHINSTDGSLTRSGIRIVNASNQSQTLYVFNSTATSGGTYTFDLNLSLWNSSYIKMLYFYETDEVEPTYGQVTYYVNPYLQYLGTLMELRDRLQEELSTAQQISYLIMTFFVSMILLAVLIRGVANVTIALMITLIAGFILSVNLILLAVVTVVIMTVIFALVRSTT